MLFASDTEEGVSCDGEKQGTVRCCGVGEVHKNKGRGKQKVCPSFTKFEYVYCIVRVGKAGGRKIGEGMAKTMNRNSVYHGEPPICSW